MIRFTGHWRRYQELALAAFERDRAAGRRNTHIVAPPGSGKTLVGLEIVARLGRPALVLAPNTAVQASWLRAAEAFDGGPRNVGTEVGGDAVCVLTYQSLCRLDDPAVVLGDLAERRWALEKAKATRRSVEEVQQEAATFAGEAAKRRAAELRRIGAALKKEIARAEHGDLHLGDLLSAGARERIEACRARGVGTVVLDECHHLASLWGYAVRAAVEELGADVHVVGLTATPPEGLTASDQALYDHLLGPVDFTVPTPAVVRDGHLAPFQELAWFTRPLDGEARWLREHDSRFRELVTALHDDVEGPLSFPGWVITRMRERGSAEAQVSWPAFQRRHPALARAGVRFLLSGGLAAPAGAPRGEEYEEPPALEDWLVLLDDYALRCLAAHESPEAGARWDAVAAALRDLGFTLTRRGIRRGRSDVDRLLVASAAKAVALCEIVGAEYEARAGSLRALVLCDGEQASAPRDDALVAVLRPEAGTAPEAVRALAGDWRTAPLAPLLLSGRGLRCAEEHAPALVAALTREAGGGAFDATPDGEGLVRVGASGLEWSPRVWVSLATRIFVRGDTQVLVGTRALLGEGWDAPCVNCLVDLTAATTSVSVTQMRGRSLRLDPSDPRKIASNWDVVCCAPELARGDADYGRFVRKHAHLLAPTEEGALEAGPSHVHPALSPFGPPPDEQFGAINTLMTERARGHEAARDRWGIGTPYAGVELATVLVRPARARTDAPEVVAVAAAEPPAYGVSVLLERVVAAGTPVAALAGAAVLGSAIPLAAVAAAPVALAVAAARLGRARAAHPDVLPLELAAHAVRDAYASLGEIASGAAIDLQPRASGYLRVALHGSPEETERFAAALDDLLEPPDAPRYLVSRGVARPGAVRAREALRGRLELDRRWHPVPADLGRTKARAEAFHAAWTRWLGPSELLFGQRDEPGRLAVAELAAQGRDYVARARRVWV